MFCSKKTSEKTPKALTGTKKIEQTFFLNFICSKKVRKNNKSPNGNQKKNIFLYECDRNCL